MFDKGAGSRRRLYYNVNPLRVFLFGYPVETAHQEHAKLPKKLALPVFASDAISSSVYATQQILLVFGAAGLAAMANRQAYTNLTLAISAAICLLLFVVVTSYWQTIFGYPSGGGSYIVSKANLGTTAGLIAAAALLIDYVLTVAVSIASGVQNLLATPAFSSYLDPQTHSPTEQSLVGFSIFFIAILTIANLRGLKESGTIFAFPTYFFVGMAYLMIFCGILGPLFGWHIFADTVNQDIPGVPAANLSAFTGMAIAMLMLKAFANGCSALTGTEAVSNGIPAFRKPEARNAALTLVAMAFILATLFAGISWLAVQFHVVYWEQGSATAMPVIDQLSGAIFGKPGASPDVTLLRGILYYCMQFSTALILLLAANTSFADFPRLSSIMAHDRFMPRPLSNVGDKLVFSNGILLLGLFSSALIWKYHGKIDDLIPLYAVGVFTAFTLSQVGMVRHWLVEGGPRWQIRAAINAVGAVFTGIVFLDIVLEKFLEGAWMVVVMALVLIWMFNKIHRHYESLGQTLRVKSVPPPLSNTVLVLVPSMHQGIINSLAYAKSISQDCRGIHILIEPEKASQLMSDWEKYVGDEVPLVILESPYRSLTGPLVEYLDEVRKERNHLVTVVVPEFVSNKWWHTFLHNNSALLIKWALLNRPGVVVSNTRYFLNEELMRDMYNVGGEEEKEGGEQSTAAAPPSPVAAPRQA